MMRPSIYLALVSGLMLGCSFSSDQPIAGRSATYKAEGVVTLDGAPVDGATVMLRSESLGLTAYGLSDAGGRFRLTTYDEGDGAPEGQFAVTVSKMQYNVTQQSDNPALPPVTKQISHLPRKYADVNKSGLTADVVPGTNRFQFDLKDDK